ncbi:MAG: CheR family methyltransferase, partial [Methylobacter sp.]
YLSNYCLKGTGSQEGTLLIERKLRERVQFMHYNLTETPPKVGEFDVIFLRNVMIYFDQDTKRQVVRRLLSLLRSGGHFLVGHSETLNGINEDVKLVQPAVYRKL